MSLINQFQTKFWSINSDTCLSLGWFDWLKVILNFDGPAGDETLQPAGGIQCWLEGRKSYLRAGKRKQYSTCGYWFPSINIMWKTSEEWQDPAREQSQNLDLQIAIGYWRDHEHSQPINHHIMLCASWRSLHSCFSWVGPFNYSFCLHNLPTRENLWKLDGT